MRLSRLFLFALITCLAVSGCQYIPIAKDYRNVKDVQVQIDKLEAKHQVELAQVTKAVENKMTELLAQKDAQLQGAADSLYGASEGFKYYMTPLRLDLIIHNRVEEAQAALGKAPTFEAIVRENARLLVELDEKKTSLAQLQSAHVEEVAAKTKLSADAVRIQGELEKLKQAKLDAETKFIADNKVLTDKLREANGTIQADLEQKASDKAATERLKAKLMTACGALALLALAGAFYSPVGKEFLVIAGAVLGGATVAIPFIEGWMIAAALGGLGVIGAIVFLAKHNMLSKANTNMVHAIQDDIEQGSTTIKKNLSAWNTKYVKNADGSITEVPDTAVEKTILATLMNIGRLPTDVNPVNVAAVPPTPTLPTS